jgi:aminomethyltransferase
MDINLQSAKRTKLFNKHVEAGAKMVEFAGYAMPIQYESILAEHKTVRESVGVFDVSHMGEFFVRGERALDCVQEVITNNAAKLVPGKALYTAMCYEDGGIVDDLLVYRLAEDEFMIVVNAANIDKDFQWMSRHDFAGAELSNLSDDYSLLAVQGPDSQKTLEKLTGAPIDLEFYSFAQTTLAGAEVILSRTGYTGELGFEIYFKGDEAAAGALWDAIFEAGAEFGIKPVGLGARDTLRLEMGYCLYGNDIDATTNPYEARLGWVVKLKAKEDFTGRTALAKVKAEGVSRKLTPLKTEGRAIPRKGYGVSANGEKIGEVTSGAMSPTLGRGVALAYLKKEFAKVGTAVEIDLRGKPTSATVVELPFVKK